MANSDRQMTREAPQHLAPVVVADESSTFAREADHGGLARLDGWEHLACELGEVPCVVNPVNDDEAIVLLPRGELKWSVGVLEPEFPEDSADRPTGQVEQFVAMGHPCPAVLSDVDEAPRGAGRRGVGQHGRLIRIRTAAPIPLRLRSMARTMPNLSAGRS
jgi:hypothetical protein